MDDKILITLLWARNSDALKLLDRKFGSRLLSTAWNILNNPMDAEETVNDTYLAVWNTIPPQKPDPLSAFIYRICRNLALKRYRDNTARKRDTSYVLSLEELSGCIPGPCLEDDFDARELGRQIDNFLDTLSSENRSLFLRRYWFGDSVRDLAKAFGLSQNAASVRLSRIRNQLKDYLMKEGYYV
jgi:RNA polymerase sigma-70 factor (ECF subfamily)